MIQIQKPLDLFEHSQLRSQTLQLIATIPPPLAVVAIIGKQKSGKSFLLNRLFGLSFKIGQSVNGCSKGIQVQIVEVRGVNLIVLDLQGYGASDSSSFQTNLAMKFALLNCNTLLFNCFSCIEQSAINQLFLLLQNRLEHIQYPRLVWVLRDFSLQMQDQEGRPLSCNQYLERCLQTNKSKSQSSAMKSNKRRQIKQAFRQRDCFKLVRPCQTQDQLRLLSQISEDQFRPEFNLDIGQLKQSIFQGIKPMRYRNNLLTGAQLVAFMMGSHQSLAKGCQVRQFNLWDSALRCQFQNEIKECLKGLKQRLTGRCQQEYLQELGTLTKQLKKSLSTCIPPEELRIVQFAINTLHESFVCSHQAFSQSQIDRLRIHVRQTRAKSQWKFGLKKEDQRESIQSLVDQLVHEIADGQSRWEQLFQELQIKAAELQSTKVQLKDCMQKFKQMTTTIASLSEEYRCLQQVKERERLSLKDEVVKTKMQSASQAQALKLLLQKLSNQQLLFQSKFNKLTKDYQILQQHAAHKDKMLQLLKTDLQKAKQTCLQLQRKQERLTGSTVVLAKQREGLRQQNQSLRRQIKELRKGREQGKRVQESLLSIFNNKSIQQQGLKLNELIETNRNLTKALDRCQQKESELQSKLLQLKIFKKICKHAKAVQCHCLQIVEVDCFLDHFKLCLKQSQETLTVKILNVSYRQQNNCPFTNYRLEVSDQSKRWQVLRRYRDFCQLNKALKKQLSIPGLSKYEQIVLPECSEINSNKNSEERVSGLQSYLAFLIKSVAKNSPHLQSFLGRKRIQSSKDSWLQQSQTRYCSVTRQRTTSKSKKGKEEMSNLVANLKSKIGKKLL